MYIGSPQASGPLHGAGLIHILCVAGGEREMGGGKGRERNRGRERDRDQTEYQLHPQLCTETST